MQKHVNDDLELHHCHPFIQELTDMDLNCRQDMFVIYSRNIGLAMGHLCCLLHLTGHFKLLTCHNSLLGFLKETVAQ
jgi:hypothetical protein